MFVLETDSSPRQGGKGRSGDKASEVLIILYVKGKPGICTLPLVPYSSWVLHWVPPDASGEQEDGSHHFLWLLQYVSDKRLLPMQQPIPYVSCLVPE